MENRNREYPRKPFIRPANSKIIEKFCKWCKGLFETLNAKREYCCDYCKSQYHYNNYLTEHANDELLIKGNYKNFLVLESCDELDLDIVSERDLLIKGFDPKVTPPYALVNGKMTAIFNQYGLMAEGEFFRIIKISKWKLDK